MSKHTDSGDLAPKPAATRWWRWYFMVLGLLIVQIIFYSWFTHYYQ